MISGNLTPLFVGNSRPVLTPSSRPTACPYCLQMFDDGLKAVGEQRDITKDMAEIVAKAL